MSTYVSQRGMVALTMQQQSIMDDVRFALESAPALYDAAREFADADTFAGKWGAIKTAGDVLVPYLDQRFGTPQVAAQAFGLQAQGWEQLIPILMPLLLEWLKQRRERR